MSRQAKDIIIIGYSGHALVVIDLFLQSGRTIVGYCDKEEKSDNPYYLPYLGSENSQKARVALRDAEYFVAIGNNSIRKLLQESLPGTAAICLDVSARLGIGAEYSSGCLIGVNTVVNPFAKIGRGAIINTAAVVEHECVIGDFAHIAPGAVLAGNVTVGEGAFVGAGAVVKQGVSIGDWAVIGAGAVVIRNVPAGATVVGNPARELPQPR